MRARPASPAPSAPPGRLLGPAPRQPHPAHRRSVEGARQPPAAPLGSHASLEHGGLCSPGGVGWGRIATRTGPVASARRQRPGAQVQGRRPAAGTASAAAPRHLPPRCCCLQGGYKYHQYQVVGRHVPTEKEPEPTIYRMKLWATDAVRAKSKFWCARGNTGGCCIMD